MASLGTGTALVLRKAYDQFEFESGCLACERMGPALSLSLTMELCFWNAIAIGKI